MALLMGLHKIALQLSLPETRRQQRPQEDALAPVKGIIAGIVGGLAGWVLLFLGWLLVR